MEHFWSIKTVAGCQPEVLGPRGKSHFIQGPGEPIGESNGYEYRVTSLFFFVVLVGPDFLGGLYLYSVDYNILIWLSMCIYIYTRLIYIYIHNIYI